MIFIVISRWFQRVIRLLDSDDTPLQIALGFGLASLMVIPDSPFFPYKLCILLILCLFNVSFKGALLAMVVVKVLVLMFRFALAPLFIRIGEQALTKPSLVGFWTKLYNAPIIPFSRFNNTYTMGGIICALFIFIPLVAIMYLFVRFYRNKMQGYLQKAKWFKAVKASKLGALVLKVVNVFPH